ncbi:citrate/2-methylcitrate synthase [Maricurvus nonylphenolicus]|uniref:citrate/2-methylcitrate synthase n=1 Tax=Maricurvus nonylphenolicus TaxID=1008307 RepID=UPI0036F2E7C0
MTTKKRRSLFSFLKNNDWKQYWTTKISTVSQETGNSIVRGYPLCDIIESNMSFAELVFLVLKGELPNEKQKTMVNVLLCSIGDYGFNSMVSVPGRTITSASPDSPMPGIAAGLLSLGRTYVSPQYAGELLEQSYATMKKENLSVEEIADRVVREYTDRGEAIPGLGHPLYRSDDLRAESLLKVQHELDIFGEKSEIYEAIRVRAEQEFDREISLNWPARVACIGAELDMAPFEYTGIAAIAYMPALIAHIQEEVTEGVPLRIIPPIINDYTGVPERPLPERFVKVGAK